MIFFLTNTYLDSTKEPSYMVSEFEGTICNALVSLPHSALSSWGNFITSSGSQTLLIFTEFPTHQLPDVTH